LGCTPELRALAAQNFQGSTVDFFDLSEVMAKSMEIVVENEYPQTNLHERFIMQNWLTLYHRPREYDLIMGIDVLNMVNRADMRLFLEIISNLLVDDGSFLTQIITLPEDVYYKDLLGLSFDEVYLKFAEMVADGEVTEEEMFVRLCFWSLNMREFTINIGDLVQRIEHLEKRIPSHRRFDIDLFPRYELCNTTLSLYTKTDFADMFEDCFNVVSKPFLPLAEVSRENVFPKYMLTYKLQKPKR
jgi:cyclopropane fatty-acyl-phospholipid synthase-like methyltransferase